MIDLKSLGPLCDEQGGRWLHPVGTLCSTSHGGCLTFCCRCSVHQQKHAHEHRRPRTCGHVHIAPGRESRPQPSLMFKTVMPQQSFHFPSTSLLDEEGNLLKHVLWGVLSKVTTQRTPVHTTRLQPVACPTERRTQITPLSRVCVPQAAAHWTSVGRGHLAAHCRRGGGGATGSRCLSWPAAPAHQPTDWGDDWDLESGDICAGWQGCQLMRLLLTFASKGESWHVEKELVPVTKAATVGWRYCSRCMLQVCLMSV